MADPTASARSGQRGWFALVWFAAATLATLLACYDLSATLAGGEFFPAGHDDFYHARRIIGALAEPLAVIQFDPRIHAPEGSWVTWPWAYDASMAAIAAGVNAVTGIEPPMRILAFIAPLWVFINAALLIGICRRLDLGLAASAVVMLCFALSPLTRLLHGAGTLDHHFVEYTFVLTALLTALGWYADLANERRALLCAVVLGAAPAFHNGLFILQLPLLITFGAVWLAGREMPRRSVLAFAMTLPLATLVFLLPSEPFRAGLFSFYLHSGFHLYISVCSALVVTALALLNRSLGNTVLIGVGALLLAVPILSEIAAGGAFLGGDIIKYDAIIETHSVFRWLFEGRYARINEFYSGLVWLLPLMLAGIAWEFRRGPSNAELYLLVAVFFGAALLLTQFRLEYFGSFALYVPGALIATRLARRRPALARPLLVAALVVVGIAHVPPLTALERPRPLGGDFQYALTRDVYPVLARACARDPGIVLAEHGDGHYVSYHTKCAVIADNFILTRQHQQKVMHSDSLLGGDLATLMRTAPEIRYVLVRRADNIYATDTCHPGCAENTGLRETLLSADRSLSPRLELLFDKRIGRGGRSEPLVRLFRIRPEPVSSD